MPFFSALAVEDGSLHTKVRATLASNLLIWQENRSIRTIYHFLFMAPGLSSTSFRTGFWLILDQV